MFRNKILAEIVKKQNNSKIISVEKFTETCLYGKYGYYNNSNVIGKKGDFITAPEISQLFGDIVGLFILYKWKTNIKKKFNFYELGPGKGTLLIDILNITKRFTEFQKFINIYLVEKNNKLVEMQKNNLLNFKFNFKKMHWLKNFTKQNNYPNIILANEFFDCFPVRQFFKKNNIWYEKMLEIKHNESSIKFKDMKVDSIKTLMELNKHRNSEVLEISNSREKYFDKICKHIFKLGGMIIVIDYGYNNQPGYFTLQSIYNNKKSNILDNLGEQDISSLVDFNRLIYLGEKNNLKIDHFSSQREFLINFGIKEREKQILQSVNDNQKTIIQNGVKRILDKKNMGNLFKVLVLSKWK